LNIEKFHPNKKNLDSRNSILDRPFVLEKKAGLCSTLQISLREPADHLLAMKPQGWSEESNQKEFSLFFLNRPDPRVANKSAQAEQNEVPLIQLNHP
jgi:hypothetical protein